MDKPEESAFPVTEYFENGNGDNVPYCEKPGLTKREWYAGMALQGLLANTNHDDLGPKEWAHDAFGIADAMVSHPETHDE